MSIEKNKAIVSRATEELWNKNNLAVVDELYATNFVSHGLPEVTPDREGYKQFVTISRTALPDFHTTVEDIIAEGDKVVQRFTARGTHKGEFMGIPPTGKQVTITGIAIDRIADSKIVENWANMDMLGMMVQLGVVPPPGQAGG